MVRLIFALVILLVLAFWAVYKMRKSKWFNDLCSSMETGYEDTPTSKQSIKDITSAETELGKQADKYSKEAERLKKDAETTKDYLNSKGVGSNDKKGGST